jgi:hypothetical protein
MTGRFTDEMFFIGAMNVDETLPSVLIMWFQAVQPKNT